MKNNNLCLLFGFTLLASGSSFADDNKHHTSSPIIANVVNTDFNLSPFIGLLSTQHERHLTLYQSDANFIKVHFSQFNIPDNAWVTVSNLAGTEVYRYDNKTGTKRTFSQSAGENGVNQFSSMSIFGDTAIVTLHLPDVNTWRSEHGIKVDHFFAGNEENDSSGSDFSPITSNAESQLFPDSVDKLSTCGVNERRDVQCWAGDYSNEFDRSRPVARLLMGGRGLCTAWRVGDSNHMFTNNHCMSTQNEVENSEIWFNYQYLECNGRVLDKVVKVTGAQLLDTDYNLDYSLFTVNDFADITQFGYFGLDVRTPEKGEQIFIPQHGAGNPKELSIESDQNAGGLCQIDTAMTGGRGTNTDTGYYCDTTGGSSGSPVLASSSNSVIALHHFGGCENQGVRIDLIWPKVANFFNNNIPCGDDNDSCDNPDPIAKQLVSGVPVVDLSDVRSSEVLYVLTTEEDNLTISVQLTGSSGDADLYVAKNRLPTRVDYDCRPYKSTSNESCEIVLQSSGKVYIMLHGYSSYDGVTLTATATQQQEP
ncbi:trypsin-like peptidase domain-containing protein [Shewanella sp. VB17]|uniref:serine protease n=1 Tax=Shewanella sp. VB17 TaxID=2739432 RepID=UPI001564ACF1|nr:serine protease [Shewanella sp. VB17]NRD73151.1 trypsin-like peptidase domain-containing protein [Shewanella sp. VB17]